MPKLHLLLALAVAFVAQTAMSQIIAVPNSDFNDNSDGDLSLVAGWTDVDAADGEQVEGVGPDGTTIMSIGDGSRFNNPTALTGVTFDTSEPGYRLTVQARAASLADFSDTAPVTEDNWGILLRDATNGNNIKTLTQPNLVTEVWSEFELFLTQEELLQYEVDNAVDVDTAEIAVRFFRNVDSGNFVGVDNVVLEISGPPVPGDVDGNGLVELADYAIIRDNQLLSPATRTTGDVFPVDGGDGVVDLADFSFWKTEFLAGGGTEAQLAAFIAAPEPTTSMIAALAIVGVSARARRR